MARPPLQAWSQPGLLSGFKGTPRSHVKYNTHSKARKHLHFAVCRNSLCSKLQVRDTGFPTPRGWPCVTAKWLSLARAWLSLCLLTLEIMSPSKILRREEHLNRNLKNNNFMRPMLALNLWSSCLCPPRADLQGCGDAPPRQPKYTHVFLLIYWTYY